MDIPVDKLTHNVYARIVPGRKVGMSNTMQWHPRWGIRMALDQDGLKQKDLAQRLGWAESRVSKLLSGEQTMSVEDLAKMAEALDRNVGELFEPNFAKGVYDGWDQLALAV